MIVWERSGSGLIVAREGMDEAAVQRSLKRLDRRFCLQKHPRENTPGGYVYKVVCFVSDTYAPVVYTHVDDHGEPLPLSSSLVDRVARLMAGSRGKPPSEDEENEKLRRGIKRTLRNNVEAIIADHKPHVQRDRVSVAFGVKKPRYWRRTPAPRRPSELR